MGGGGHRRCLLASTAGRQAGSVEQSPAQRAPPASVLLTSGSGVTPAAASRATSSSSWAAGQSEVGRPMRALHGREADGRASSQQRAEACSSGGGTETTQPHGRAAGLKQRPALTPLVAARRLEASAHLQRLPHRQLPKVVVHLRPWWRREAQGGSSQGQAGGSSCVNPTAARSRRWRGRHGRLPSSMPASACMHAGMRGLELSSAPRPTCDT